MGDRDHDPNDAAAFERLARGRSHGLVRELLDLLRENRKWWLVPIVAVLLVLALLVALGSTGAAPFIYTLF